jgi:hypothetical protein
MSLLVAVKSCLADLDRGFHDVIRATWGQQLRGKAHLKFFVGAERDGKTSRVYKSDEVAVDVADDYNSLPSKTRAICQWAFSKAIDHVFLADTDTYVKVNQLLTCGYQRYDYTGKISKPIGETFPYDAIDRRGVVTHIPECYPWASGGFGYFLSRDAMCVIADTFPSGYWAEDLFVGQTLGKELAKGDMIALDLPANSYSSHFPSSQYKSGYKLEYRWMETADLVYRTVNS